MWGISVLVAGKFDIKIKRSSKESNILRNGTM